MTVIAMTTAFQVNTISMPARCQQRARAGRVGENSMSRTRPIATGGITSGSVTTVSSSTRPRNRPRARSQASSRPGGSMSSVASAGRGEREPGDVPGVHRVSAAAQRRQRRELVPAEDRGGLRAAKKGEEPFGGRAVARRRHDGGRVDDARRRGAGDHQDGLRARRDFDHCGGVGLVRDRGVRAPVLDRRHRRADVRDRHQLRLQRVPDADRLQVLPRVHAGRHRGRIPDGDPANRRLEELARVVRTGTGVPPGRMSTARRLPSRSMRVRASIAGAATSICDSSALMNRSTGAPLTIWRASMFEPPKLKRTGPCPAAWYARAIASSDSVRLIAAETVSPPAAPGDRGSRATRPAPRPAAAIRPAPRPTGRPARA